MLKGIDLYFKFKNKHTFQTLDHLISMTDLPKEKKGRKKLRIKSNFIRGRNIQRFHYKN